LGGFEMLLGPPAPAGTKLILVTADVKLQVSFADETTRPLLNCHRPVSLL
jgi:hypothetical protein